jgi:hypothetical protein
MIPPPPPGDVQELGRGGGSWEGKMESDGGGEERRWGRGGVGGWEDWGGDTIDWVIVVIVCLSMVKRWGLGDGEG